MEKVSRLTRIRGGLLITINNDCIVSQKLRDFSFFEKVTYGSLKIEFNLSFDSSYRLIFAIRRKYKQFNWEDLENQNIKSDFEKIIHKIKC